MFAYPLLFAAILGVLASLGSMSLFVVPQQQQTIVNAGVMDYDVFVLAAKTFMATNPANGTYTWANLSALNSSTFTNATIPSSWKLVVYGLGQYVICTSHGYQQQMMLLSSRLAAGKTPYQLNSSTLVTSTDSTTAQAQASLCN